MRRTYDTGVSFCKEGFQLEPEWTLSFASDTTVKIYNPEKNQFVLYSLYHSHDSVFNFAREYFRVKTVTKDSLIFQLLQVNGRKVSKEDSNVYLTFYSTDYIQNVLHSNPESVKRPSRKDTLFVKRRVKLAKGNSDSVFAARNPVVFESKHTMLQVKKVTASKDDPLYALLNIHSSDEYLHPEYRIDIKNAYKDFAYEFTATVDEMGKIHFRDFRAPIRHLTPEFFVSKRKIVKALIEGYLHNLLKITPGKTLGIPHTSVVNILVVGRKGSAFSSDIAQNR